MPPEVPLPPLEMRRMVGPVEDFAYENPTGVLVWGDQYPPERYRSVFDFGCGCGRVARQLMLQDTPPERYLGIDLHKGMIKWCRRNLTPHAPGFEFRHHPVYNAGFNPREKRMTAPFPAADSAFSLVTAWSVFTHLVESQVDHYLAEIARVLEPDGVFQGTWFLIDRGAFPMLWEGEHGLYSNDRDPTHAALFDRDWVQERVRAAGLTIYSIDPPTVRGYHTVLRMTPTRSGVAAVEIPEDVAPLGGAPAM
jgi:SAM-dependent methyltransferase